MRILRKYVLIIRAVASIAYQKSSNVLNLFILQNRNRKFFIQEVFKKALYGNKNGLIEDRHSFQVIILINTNEIPIKNTNYN